MTDKQPEALQVPLHELLEAIPEDWRIGVKDNDDWSAGTTWHPVGVMCHQAAAELRRLYANNTDLLNALRDCAAWMEDLRASGDAGNWDWEADEYTRAMEAIAKATGEQQ
jgi:hypothetical protein